MSDRTFKDRQNDRRRRSRIGKNFPNLITPEEGLETATSEKLKSLIRSFKGAPMVIDTRALTVFCPYNGTIRLAKNGGTWRNEEDARSFPFPKAENVGNPVASSQMLNSKRGEVLAMIAMNPFLTIRQVAEALGRTHGAVVQDLHYLKKRGLIGRCDKWVINPCIVGEGKPFIPLRTKEKRKRQGLL